MERSHTLRFKLTSGVILVLALALMLCCTLITHAARRVMESSIVSLTISEERTLLAHVSEQLTQVGAGSAEDSLAYIFKGLAAQADAGSEYVLQLEDTQIYNNSGFSAKALLSAKGTTVNEDDGDYTFYLCSALGESYCIVGREYHHFRNIYQISVVKNITATMQQLRRLQAYCLSVSAAVTVLAAVLITWFLSENLRPLATLRRSAESIAAGDYSGRISVPQKDEIGMVAQSFNKMAQAVENHIAEVEKTSHQRNMLLHALSHEMRTPVTAISGYAYALTHLRMDETQRGEAIAFMESESRRLERLYTKLAELLMVSDFQIQYAPIDPAVFARRIRSLLAPTAQQHGIRLEVRMDRADVLGDLDLLLMLVTNLYDNARKAGAGVISITLSKGILSVTDDGSGISPEILDKIMEPFYQGDASRNQEGFGLGLALCRRIAMLHGSDLTVESTPGHGSTFTTLLQLHDDSQTPQPV